MGVHFRDVNLPFQDRAQLCSPSYSSPSPWLSVLSKQSSLSPQALQTKCSGLHGLQEAM